MKEIKVFLEYVNSTLTTSITLTLANGMGIWDVISDYERRNPKVRITHYLNEDNEWISTDAMRTLIAKVEKELNKPLNSIFQ